MLARSEDRGQGLGRRFFETCIAAARRMGCGTLRADTVRGNMAMPSMYEEFGSPYVTRHEENGNVSAL